MPTQLVTCNADDTMDRAIELMTANGIRHLLVVDGGRLVHVLSVRDVITYLAKSANTGEKAAKWSTVSWL